MKITLISDTHSKHKQLDGDLPGGEILIHAGDFMNSGYVKTEATEFFDWFDAIDNYDTKILIAGNHDRIMENDPEWAQGILTGYKTIEYLQDDDLTLYYDGHNGDLPEDNVRIYGSPWQPEFCDWAFNLPRNGEELKGKWDLIPSDTDILITHGPAWGYVDKIRGTQTPLGCELLVNRIKEIKPKIHVCGHIHSGYGYYFDGDTHFINASVLGESYYYENDPITVEWDPKTNEMEFL
jgi:Icc-related predicted phosphoesterase